MSRRAWCALAALALAGCETAPTPLPVDAGTLDQQLRAQLGRWGAVPIGAVPAQDSNLVKLGRALMFDPILSGNRDVACASCHQPAAHLTDARSLPSGTKGRLVPRSAPTLLGGGLGLYQLFWDGRLSGSGGGIGPCCGGSTSGSFFIPPNTFISAPNILAAQAGLPVLNRAEMRGDSGDLDRSGNPNELAAVPDAYSQTVYNLIMTRLMAIPEYVAMFDAAFPSGASHDFTQAAAAMGAFQISALTLTGSPFDRYLNRDDAALSTEEKEGALLFFTTARCSQCHSGPLLGAQQIANVGVPQIGVGLDSGRGALGDLSGGPGVNFYRFAFRVAPLRNVELTAPYFHDGAYPTLEAVVRHYNDVHAALRSYDPLNLAPEFRSLIHTDNATIALMEQTLDSRITTPIGLTDPQQRQLVAFLKSLTDPAARNLAALRPASVPSGLPVP